MSKSERGQIVTRKGNRLLVQPIDGGKWIRCAQRKKLPALAIGDQVEWESTSKGEGVITALESRDSLLTRPDPFNQRNKPIAANINQILVVTASEPGIDPLQVDRILVAAAANKISALLVINKVDLLDDEDRTLLEQQLAHYQQLPLPLLWTSTTEAHGLDQLREQLQGHSSVLVGPSGAGKSSIIQALLPYEEITVGALSEGIGQGKHTTSASTLYALPDGGTLIDSPGIREFGLWHLDEETIRNGFMEFDSYRGECRFSNCRHLSEPGCAVNAAVDSGEISAARFENYQLLISER
jgi:ribosome biogenesis GTPase / thiamine phosphate phosphatase